MIKKSSKVAIYMTPDLFDEIDAMAKQFGVKRTQLTIIAINAGLDALKLASSPDWNGIFESISKRYDATNGKSSSEQA